MKIRRNQIIWSTSSMKNYEKPRLVKAILRNLYHADVIEVDNKNLTHDVIIQKNSMTVTAEIKERLFDKDHTVPYFYHNKDILIELFQYQDIIERAYKKMATPKDLITGFGWMWKSMADRLIYISYYDDDRKEVRVWDIDFKPFKAWFLDNVFKYSISDYKISQKTSGALNIAIPISDVPDWMYKEIILKGE